MLPASAHAVPSPRPARSRRAALILPVILVVGFLVRCLYVGDVFSEGRVIPFDPDSFYHLWRIEETAHTGAPPHFDRFTSAPVGARVLYPYGFDGGMGLVVRLLAGAHASRFAVLALSLFAQPLLGALALLAVFGLARRATDGTTALVATSIAALLPCHVLAGVLGRVDHHVFEVGLPPLVVLLLTGERRPVLRALAAGAILAALFACAMTGALHAGLIALALTVAALVVGLRGDVPSARHLLATTAGAFATAALLLAPSALRTGGLAFDGPSALPVVLLAVGSTTLGLMAALGRGTTRRFVTAVMAVGAIAAIALCVGLWEAVAYVAGPHYNAMIVEAQPLWRDPWGALQQYSLALPIIPLVLVGCARRGSPAMTAVAVMGICGLIMCFGQGRFGWLVPVHLSIALAALVTAAWRRWRHVVPRLLVTACLLLTLAPSVLFLVESHAYGRDAVAMMDAADWLATNSPAVGGRLEREPAPWTVLTMWDYGNYIAWWAARPVVATSFQNQDYAPALHDFARILYGDADPQPLLDQRRVRYVVLPAQDSGPEYLHRRLLLGQGPATTPTLYRRLSEFDGSAVRSNDGTMILGQGQFRLVHESILPASIPGRDAPALKIFERVAGARLVGACESGVVLFETMTTSDRGRPIQFRTFSDCHDQHFSATVPYAGRTSIRASGGWQAEATVSEEDVVAGRELTVPRSAP